MLNHMTVHVLLLLLLCNLEGSHHCVNASAASKFTKGHSGVISIKHSRDNLIELTHL